MRSMHCQYNSATQYWRACQSLLVRKDNMTPPLKVSYKVYQEQSWNGLLATVSEISRDFFLINMQRIWI